MELKKLKEKIMNKSQYNSLYSVYVDRYKKAAKAQTTKSLPIDRMYTKKEFEQHFNIHKNTFVEEGVANPKPVQIVKDMIDRQRYGTSTEKQGRATYIAINNWVDAKRNALNAERATQGLAPIQYADEGHPVDIETIRTFYEYMSDENEEQFNELPEYQKRKAAVIREFFDELKSEYQAYKNSGLDGVAAKHLIAQKYFGSP